MTGEQLSQVMSDMTRRHQNCVEQLTKLFGTEGGPGVFDLAEKVLGPGVRAADWLTSGQIGLDGAIPAVLALESDGRERVMTYLMQIEHGVFV